MPNQDFFDNISTWGNLTEAMLLPHELAECGDELKRLGLLVRTNLNGHVICPECGEMLPWTRLRNPDGNQSPLANCPDCGMFVPCEKDFQAWRVDFTPMLSAAAKYLKCSGQIKELLPSALWKLGRAPLAGQSREIFAGRALNHQRINEVAPGILPSNNTAILLVVGNLPQLPFGGFVEDRTFLLKDFCRLGEHEIVFDTAAMASILQGVLNAQPKKAKSQGRHSRIGDLIIKLKAELRQYMVGIYGAIEQAESSGRDYDFRPLKQVELARMMNVDKYTITRALQTDLELKALFDAAGNRASVYAYGRKSVR